MSDAILHRLTEVFRQKIAAEGGFKDRKGVLRLDLGLDGIITIDGRQDPNVVSNNGIPADCVVRTTVAAIEASVLDDEDGSRSVWDGDVEILGDISIVFDITDYIGG
jgi:ubiquinone biosynthesis protein UbiJ